jgi:hypothetical protein
MRSNGVFSGISGLTFLIGAKPLSEFVGVTPSSIFAGLGAVLLLYAVTLFLATSRPELDRRLGYAAVVLDIGWVVGSAVILLSGWLPLTTAGNWTVALLAEAVALFAVWQAYALHHEKKTQ